MKISISFVGLVAALLGGCASVPSVPTGPISTRELTAVEKSALAPIFAQKLKDPGSAQFKWMPVVVAERADGATDYCGLVNGRNSYGGYTGYLRFYAQLVKDDKGHFTRGEARAFEEPNRRPNLIDTRWLNGICEGFGYADFSAARE